MTISKSARQSIDSKSNAYTVLLVCDFPQQGLLFRILDLYRFFRDPPRIILVRKGKNISVDATRCARVVAIPLPVFGLEEIRFLSAFPAVLSYLFCAFGVYLKIRRWRTSVQLVHSQHIFPQGLFGLMLARMMNVPLIVSATGGDVNITMTHRSVLRAASLLVLKRAWTVIAMSKPLQDTLCKFGISNSIYIPNSVDHRSIQAVEQSAKEDSILFVGSITQRKRPLVLLQAFDSVTKLVPTATLIMVGAGPQMDALRREIATRGLTKRVTCIPDLNRHELNRVRAKTQLFVLPSASEGLSLALLEAMAAGQVVIASRNESHEAVLKNGENALLFATDDSGELACQILLAIGDRALRRRISRSAKALVEKEFSNSVVAGRLEDLYLKALWSQSHTM